MKRPQETWDRAIQMVRSGVRVVEAAQACGVSRSQLQERCRVGRVPSATAPKDFTLEREVEARALILSGFTLREVQQCLRMGRAMAQGIRHGLDLPRYTEERVEHLRREAAPKAAERPLSRAMLRRRKRVIAQLAPTNPSQERLRNRSGALPARAR